MMAKDMKVPAFKDRKKGKQTIYHADVLDKNISTNSLDMFLHPAPYTTSLTKPAKAFVLDPRKVKAIFSSTTTRNVINSDVNLRNTFKYSANEKVKVTKFSKVTRSESVSTKADVLTSTVPIESGVLSIRDQNKRFKKRHHSLSLVREEGLAASRLKSAKFRFLNEKLYKSTGTEALQYFRNDPTSFYVYHTGYQQQVDKWPTNPLDLIIEQLKQLSPDLVIADMGCGDANIAKTFPERTVHSFDLFALNDHVTVCDMAKVPLSKSSVDICIFCLSLMGTNFVDYIKEAKRILKLRGLLIISEVQSRFKDRRVFKKNMQTLGFKLNAEDWNEKMFTIMTFKKKRKSPEHCMLSDFGLSPCFYKKR